MTAKTFSLMSFFEEIVSQLFALDQIVRTEYPRQVLCQMVCQWGPSQQRDQGHMPEGRSQYQKHGTLC